MTIIVLELFVENYVPSLLVCGDYRLVLPHAPFVSIAPTLAKDSV